MMSYCQGSNARDALACLLERFPIFLNRLGFPNQRVSDSNCMLAKEAGMHVQAPLARSA